MKLIIFYMVLFPSICCNAFETSSFSEAWKYISAKSKSERWLVVSSNKKGAYFQCENLDNVVRCVIPIWVKLLAFDGAYYPKGGQVKPYPEIKNSKLEELLAKEKIEIALSVLKKFKLEPSYVYSQDLDESERIVGTQCDIRVALDLNFQNFEPLAKDYLKQVFGVTETDGYKFEFDS